MPRTSRSADGPTGGPAPREVHVWRVPLADASREPARAAMRDILSRYTAAPIEFALREKGKPYLPSAPDLRFNLSHAHGMALVAVALDVEVGVDVEKLRPLPEFAAIAARFFPPNEPVPADEVDFFRAWTRIEAVLKGRGVGLLGAGDDPGGDWTVLEIDAGEQYRAAVAVAAARFALKIHDYGENDEDRRAGRLLPKSR